MIRASIPTDSIYPWESQRRQFPEQGPVGLALLASWDLESVEPWSPDAPADPRGEPEVVCHLQRGDDGRLRGIAYWYGRDSALERRGNVNLWVDPDSQRQGVGSALLDSVVACHGLDIDQQSYTPAGAALVAAWARRRHGIEVEVGPPCDWV